MKARRRFITSPKALALALVGFLIVLIEMLRAAHNEWQLDFQPPHMPVSLPTGPELAGTLTVDLAPTGEERLTAFYKAPRNGRTIVLLHGSAANRAQLLPEARLLARHGFGFLSLDFPGHGDSGGSVHWDAGERSAVTQALDWAGRQNGVDGQQLGLLGFSMGAWFALQVAVLDPRVRGLVLSGAFADVKQALVADKGRHFGWFVEEPTLWAARALGLRYAERRSIDLIPAFAPRPVFLIAGSADDDVPASSTILLYEAAREPKSFWLVPDAKHGEYATKATSEYEQRLTSFFTEALHPDSR